MFSRCRSENRDHLAADSFKAATKRDTDLAHYPFSLVETVIVDASGGAVASSFD